MESIFFDDLESNMASNDKKPFFALFEQGEPSDDDLLKWLEQEFLFLKKEYQPWHEEIRNNYKRYKEIQYRDQVYQHRDLPDRKNRYMPQVVAPLVRDMTDERIARMMEYRPDVSILPQHDESQDKADAKIAKKFTKHIDYQERMEYKWQKFLRTVFAAGEGYLVTRWNPDKGMTVSGPNGQTAFLGDVDVKAFSPLRWIQERCHDEQEPEYGFLIEFEYADKLKKQYPSSADEIQADGRVQYYDAEMMEDRTDLGKCVKLTFWHKKTPYMPQGYECVFLLKKILKRGALPYDHGMLPVVDMKDNENLEESHGRSYIVSMKGMIAYFNNLLNMSIKQMTLMSWPKWFIDQNSVDDQQLNNDTGIVKLAPGSREPKLAQGSPVSPQLMDWMNKSLEWVYSWGKSNSVVRGEPPAGVTAFVALQYVSESENRRLNLSVVKFAEAVRRQYQMILATCGQYYKKEDERTMLVIGKDNSWSIQNYDPATLAKNYSIVIQNSSSLPDSRSARTQFILDIEEKKPGFFSNEQFAEMLDFAQSDKYLDEMGAAARAADAENQMMMEGLVPEDPAEYEFLITHWKAHTQAMQGIPKNGKNTKIIEIFKDHVMATEMLMADQAVKSPSFAQALSALAQWPMLFTLPPPLPPQDMGAIGAPPPPPMPEEQMSPEVMQEMQSRSPEASMAPDSAEIPIQ